METLRAYCMSKLIWIAPVAITAIFGVYCFLDYPFGSKILMGVLCLFSWYACLSMPTRISMERGRLAIFESILTTTELRIEEITSIERNGKTTTIRHRNGKLEVSNMIPDIDEFFESLKELNPSIGDDLGSLAKFAQSPLRVAGLVLGLTVLAVAIAALAINIPAVGRLFH